MKTNKVLNKNIQPALACLTALVFLLLVANRSIGAAWEGTDDFSSGISSANWPVQQVSQGQMTVTGVNGHVSFLVPVSTTAEQNAYIAWRGNPTAAEDWTADITGHNSASYSGNGASALQFAVLRTDHVGTTNQEGYVVSMAQGSNGNSNPQFGATQWLGPGGTNYIKRATNSAPSDLFGLRLVYHSASKIIEAWFDPDGSGLNWTLLDTISLADFSPTMTASNTFVFAIVSDTYYGPIAEGQIWADNFRITNSAIGSPLPQGQVQWAERVATTTSLPTAGGPLIGLVLDSQANCYVTGCFDGTNNFGGVTLTNQSIGGSDIFVAKYNANGALQWAQRAGGSAGNMNMGRRIGVDTNGNVYVAGHVYGPASFGGFNLSASSYQNFFLAKYNSTGAVQWVEQSIAGYDIRCKGLAVDGAGNSYALLYLMGTGNVTLGTTNLNNPSGDAYSLVLVKYDSTGTVQWAQLLGAPGSSDTSGCAVAVDAAGNVYVCGLFEASIMIGTTNLTGSATSWNIFIAKFNGSGALTWVQQPTGGNPSAGVGAAVDPAGNVYVACQFTGTINFSGINVTNGGGFVAKYNSSGVIQWADQAAVQYEDVDLDGQTNVYAAGLLNSNAAIVKYSPCGTLQWAYSASSPPASPFSSEVMKCAGDSSNNCYLAGWYQGTNTFGTNVLQPQELWNFFLAKVAAPASPTLGIVLSNGVPRLSLAGAISSMYSLQWSPIVAATNTSWQTLATFPLTNSPQLYLDTSVQSHTNRFYRAAPPAL